MWPRALRAACGPQPESQWELLAAVDETHARQSPNESDPQPVLTEKLHRGGLRTLFSDLIGERDPGADGQFGKLSAKKAIAMEIDLRAIA